MKTLKCKNLLATTNPITHYNIFWQPHPTTFSVLFLCFVLMLYHWTSRAQRINRWLWFYIWARDTRGLWSVNTVAGAEVDPTYKAWKLTSISLSLLQCHSTGSRSTGINSQIYLKWEVGGVEHWSRDFAALNAWLHPLVHTKALTFWKSVQNRGLLPIHFPADSSPFFSSGLILLQGSGRHGAWLK